MTDIGPPLSPETRNRLNTIRNKLLHLHKAILDAERASYERSNGPIASPHVFLQLVMNDPWFGWFRPISEIVVRIDIMLESKEPVSQADGELMLIELRSLLAPREDGEEFGVKYHRIMQHDPAIIPLHSEIAELLAP